MANDCDFWFLKIISLLKYIFLHKYVKHPLLKFDRLCHHSVKIIFFRYSKPLSVEIMENGWRALSSFSVKSPCPWILPESAQSHIEG